MKEMEIFKIIKFKWIGRSGSILLYISIYFILFYLIVQGVALGSSYFINPPIEDETRFEFRFFLALFLSID